MGNVSKPQDKGLIVPRNKEIQVPPQEVEVVRDVAEIPDGGVALPPPGITVPKGLSYLDINEQGRPRFVEERSGIVFVSCPPGKFLMGSPAGEGWQDEWPQHEVTIDYEVIVSETPVTQGQWQRVMGSNPSRFQGDEIPADVREMSDFDPEMMPVESVSWVDCQDFCKELRGPDGVGARLPSEAEWEYFARAGDTGARPVPEDLLFTVAWFGRASTMPVRLLSPNNWGLYDTLGNVHEWCEDEWHPNYNGAPCDGSAWVSDSEEGDKDGSGD